jgi:tetratricopeptide (TPR) repeat protein
VLGSLNLAMAAWLTAGSLAAQPASVAPASNAGFDAIAAAAARAREGGDAETALGAYRRGVAMRAAWDEGRWYIGALEYERRRFDVALDAFTALLERQPEHAAAEAMAGLCEFELGRYEPALRRLMRARERGVAHNAGIASVVRYHTAILLTRFGEFEVGSAVLAEPGLDLDESPAMIQAFGLNALRMPMLPGEVPAESRPLVDTAGRAALAMAARRAAAARTAFDALVARYPGVSRVHYARGVFLLAEDPELAMADFERELTITPGDLATHLQLAFERLRRGEVDKARPHAVEAVRINPAHAVARLALGQVELEAGHVDRAVVELEQAVRIAPDSAQPHFVLARAYARAGRVEDAARERAAFERLNANARRR